MFPVAIAAGNSYILKPSEVDPGAPMLLAKLAKEAGVPAGCLNIIHGTHVRSRLSCATPSEGRGSCCTCTRAHSLARSLALVSS